MVIYEEQRIKMAALTGVRINLAREREAQGFTTGDREKPSHLGSSVRTVQIALS
jgi:hypothetical protein